MPRIYLERDASGAFPSYKAASGVEHEFIVRKLVLEHRYHDDEPLQRAPYKVTFPNGYEVVGELDEQGRATLYGVPAEVKVVYGPDQRQWCAADTRENPDYRESTSSADLEQLFQKYGTGLG